MNEPESPKVEPRSVVYLDYARIGELVQADLRKKNELKTFFRKYKKEDIRKYLESPWMFEKQLREISNFLYHSSLHYKRLILYFATLLRFDYILKPQKLNKENLDMKRYENAYFKICGLIDNMNIKHEFTKALKIAFREDVFYGYILSTENSFYIKKLDPNYCRISTISDGILNYEFNLSIFNTQEEKLKNYPPEFKEKYNEYKKTKKSDHEAYWVEFDPKNTVCIKINEDIPEYCVPPFIGVVDALLDIEEFKDLVKAREHINNYKILVMEIPMRENSEQNNDFLIEWDQVKKFYNLASSATPDQVGVITSPMKIDTVSFEKDRADIDNVANAVREFWNAAGVSQHLFTTDKSSSVALSKSVITDEALCFSVLSQIERWMNRYLKLVGGNYKFLVELLKTTQFNWQDIAKGYLESAKFGLPVKMQACAALGMTPTDVLNMNYLEEEVFGLTDKFIPLKSSHTGGGDSPGRPLTDEDDLVDGGIESRDGEKNLDE